MAKRVTAGAIVLGAAVGSFAAPAAEAQTGKKLSCRFKGTWIESKDDFEFDAVYTIKNGPDTFVGVYENPGQAKANVMGTASSGTWTILLSYTDAKHANMSKKLIGNGTRDTVKNELVISGGYKTYIGTNDIKQSGTFKFQGKCK